MSEGQKINRKGQVFYLEPNMKVIIAGSRSVTDYNTVVHAIGLLDINIDEILSGGATGVDMLGERYAKYYNIPIKRFEADWKTYGKSAGARRNEEMAKKADALIAVWDGESKGTKDMIDRATANNLIVLIWPVKVAR